MPRWLGEILALPLRRVPVRIRGGPNQGLRWSLAVAGRRGYLDGDYEGPRLRTLGRLIEAGDCFWDVGAHQGYVALLAARAVGRHGRVLCFEPSAHNRWYLETHAGWSGLPNLEVVPAALGAADGTARFGGSRNSVLFHVGEGDETVEVRSVDSLVAEGHPSPTYLKVDAEGSEADILRGAARALGRVEVAVVSVHSLRLYEECVALLRAADFDVHHHPRIARVLSGLEPWGGDPEIVGFSRRAAERRARFASAGGFEPVAGGRVAPEAARSSPAPSSSS